MKRPFNIFPSIGYRNSQFQVISNADNLKIDIYDKDKIVKTIEANSKNPTLLTSLGTTGKLIAKCNFNNSVFQQELEIKEAYRLGSSEFKKAFVFDDTEYSFFLMKDRLLLYNEKKKILLTENHYSPTEIYKINGTNFLFVTKVGNSTSGIINLGVYNTENFSMVGELLNDYREIKILADNNKAWLYNIKSKTVHCYELAHQTNKYLIELKSFENFNDYFLDDANLNIYINDNEVLKVSSLNNLHKSFEILKKENNAIDKLGNVFTLENCTLRCTSLLTNYSETVNPNFEVRLQSENFIHVGKDLKSEYEFTDLNKKAEEIMEEVIPSLPDTLTYYYHSLPELQRITETYTTHNLYPTTNGVFIIQKKIKRDFNGLTLRKYQGSWIGKPNTIETTEFTLLLLNSGKTKILIDKTPNLIISGYNFPTLLVSSNAKHQIFSGIFEMDVKKIQCVSMFTVNEISYCLFNTKESLINSFERYSLYKSSNLSNPILQQIEILNLELITKHNVIWYKEQENHISSGLKAFDLSNITNINIDYKAKGIDSHYWNETGIRFFEGYALNYQNIVFNPTTFEIKDTFIGKIESYSKNLNKIISYRTNIIYLSIFNSQLGNYELSEISIDDNKYRESYLSPNGQFLVLQDENNKYSFYDIEKGETINFISGSFLAFRNDGSLIVEQDGTRAVKIIDPKTFQDITPPNYHHYRFMSPDGKLYAQVSSKIRYSHKLNDKELKVEEVTKFRQDLDEPSSYLKETENKQAQLKVDKNRLQIFTEFKEKLQSLGIKDYKKINSHHVIQIDKYIEIGILGTEIIKKISIPADTQFYNYAAFSFDNNYLGIVGKPVYGSINRSLIMICSLSFDESNLSLELVNYTVSRFPRCAAWVCGFSKTGYFATYDSSPDTFLIKMDEYFFSDLTSDTELKNNIYNLRSNIYNTYKKWNVIKDKNFLCFSPSGNFLALSEQGYEPLTLGGYGHQESNVVHIAKTESGAIIDSFTGHGDKIKEEFHKKVTFVAFSEDESRIMTLSSDGVVIIRDINISDNEQDYKMSAANKRLTSIMGEVVN